MFGLSIVGIGSYILNSSWGNLDKSFFNGWCTILILFGFFVLLISIFGCLGILHQVKRDGCWTGRKVLAVYVTILIGALAAEIYMAMTVSNTLLSLKSARSSLSTNTVLDYDAFENALAARFNTFFFGAASVCNDINFVWFWDFVNNKCPASVNQAHCQACNQYTITMCSAFSQLCYKDSSAFQYACPYVTCRSQMLTYVINQLGPFYYFTFFFMALQLAVLGLSCCLICFHDKDVDQEVRDRIRGSFYADIKLKSAYKSPDWQPDKKEKERESVAIEMLRTEPQSTSRTSQMA